MHFAVVMHLMTLPDFRPAAERVMLMRKPDEPVARRSWRIARVAAPVGPSWPICSDVYDKPQDARGFLARADEVGGFST